MADDLVSRLCVIVDASLSYDQFFQRMVQERKEAATEIERLLTENQELRTIITERMTKDLEGPRATPASTDKPWAQHPVRTLHACVETLASAFKGFLPWADEHRGQTVRGHEMLIKDTLERADACLTIIEHATATRSEKAHSEEKEFAAGMVLAAAFAIVDDIKWTTGMKDGDPHKGLGNYLADAVRAYREAR